MTNQLLGFQLSVYMSTTEPNQSTWNTLMTDFSSFPAELYLQWIAHFIPISVNLFTGNMATQFIYCIIVGSLSQNIKHLEANWIELN